MSLQEGCKMLLDDGLTPEGIMQIVRIYLEGRKAGKSEAEMVTDMRHYLETQP